MIPARLSNVKALDQIVNLRQRMGESIIGQEAVVERLIIGLLANGNLLVEGLPGLAKTRAIKALAKNLEADFSRIQFTPDLLPSDVTGTEVYYQKDGAGEFRFEPGARSLPTSCWVTRSTVRLQKCRRRCSKQWRNARSPLRARRTRCRPCSW